MGTIRNEMTIVHHYNKDELEKVREDAIKFFNEVANEDSDTHINVADLMISPIMESYINQEYTFVINGDCSKIGWGTSELFHEARMKWCEKHKHDVQSIVVINFGEGDKPCRIVFDSTGLKTESEERMAYAKKCDICGKLYESPICNDVVRIHMDFGYLGDRYVDLCDDCYSKLCNFVKPTLPKDCSVERRK